MHYISLSLANLVSDIIWPFKKQPSNFFQKIKDYFDEFFFSEIKKKNLCYLPRKTCVTSATSLVNFLIWLKFAIVQMDTY